jgi:RNA polymerase sigma factor (sigma-70 family)
LYFRTPKDQRATYVYQSRTGETFTLRPGEDGVTEANIAALHRADDDECNNEQQRYRKDRVIVPEVLSLEEVDPNEVLVAGKAADPLEAAIKTENTQMIHKAIALLPEKQAKAVMAIWLGGMSVKEYADLEETKEYNVRKLYHRAFKTLRKKFSKN